MTEFWRRGFEGVTFRRLSVQTGLGLRSLSNTFDDKETLYVRALELYVARVEENLPKLIAQGGAEAITKLFAVLTAQYPADAPRQNGCLIVNQMAVVQFHDGRLQAVIDRYFDCLRRNYGAALKAAAIIDDLDNRVGFLITLFVGVQMTIRLHSDTRAAAGIEAQVAAIIRAWREQSAGR